MATFNASEVLQFALEIERNGERFYRLAEAKFEEPELKKLFRLLATEEVGHEHFFGGLAAQAELVPREELPEEYYSYLEAFVKNVVFSADAEESLRGIEAPVDAVRFAMRREADSVQFYTELRRLVPDDQRGAVDAIIEEERRHFLSLTELEERLSG